MAAILLAAVVGVGLMLWSTYRVLRDSKANDAWAIYFLNMERQAQDLADELGPRPAAMLHESVYLRTDTGNTLKLQSGVDRAVTSLADFGIKQATDLAAWNLVWLRGSPYALVSSGRKTVLAPFNRSISLKPSVPPQAVIYVATKQGRLVYRNNGAITQEAFLSRELVQKFIELPVNKGQIELTAVHGAEAFGFFAEVPATNLVLFAETPKVLVAHDVRTAVRHLAVQLLGVFAGLLGLAVLLLNLQARRKAPDVETP